MKNRCSQTQRPKGYTGYGSEIAFYITSGLKDYERRFELRIVCLHYKVSQCKKYSDCILHARAISSQRLCLAPMVFHEQ